MLYDQYRKKIELRLEALRKLLKLLAKAALVCAVVAAAVLGVEFARGIFTEGVRCEDITYGDEPSFGAKAFWIEPAFEFSREGEEWSSLFSGKTGSYRLRAVTENRLGTRRFSEEGGFAVLQRPLVIQPKELSFVYGDPLEWEASVLQADNLARGDRIDSFRLVFNSLLPGETQSRLEEVVIRNSEGEDVTACYALQLKEGKATVAKRGLGLSSSSAEKEYDGTPLTCPQVTVESGSTAVGHRYELSFSASLTEIGEMQNRFTAKIFDGAGRDVTEHYDLKREFGTLTVTPRKLVLETGSGEKIYDGTPLSVHSYEITSGSLLPGHSHAVDFLSQPVYPGSYDNSIKLRLFDENGKDVSEFYILEPLYGTLTVQKRVVHIQTGSDERPFDGTYLSCREYTVTEGSVLKDERLSVYSFSTIKYPGEIANELQFVVIDKNTNRLLAYDCYDFVLSYGTLRILPSDYEENIHGGGTPEKPDGDNPQGGVDVGGMGGTVGGGGGSSGMSGGKDGFTDFSSKTTLSKNSFSLSSSPAFRVFSEKSMPLYLKGMSYGRYNGYGFDQTLAYTGALFPYHKYNNSFYPGLQAEKKMGGSYKLSIDYYTDKSGTALLPYHLVSLEEAKFYTVSDVSAQLAHRSYQFGMSVADVSSILEKKLYEGWAESSEEKLYRQYVHYNFLSLPEKTEAAVQAFLKQNGMENEKNIGEIAAFVQNCGVYNTDFQSIPASCDDVAMYFLTVSKEGVCQHFAAAGTVIFRALGYPARYATGYFTHTAAGEWMEVPASNAHAWVEIYLDGFGWIPVEVTGSGLPSGDQPPTVDPRPKVTLRTLGGSFVYNGVSQRAEGYELLENQLKEGHRIVLESTGFLKPGTYLNYVQDFRIEDESGNNVTVQYNVQIREGTVKILPRPITISTGSAHKQYDGTPLTCEEFTVISGVLPDRFRVLVRLEASVTEKGSVKNELSEIRIERQREPSEGLGYVDVTSCFTVSLGNIGTLTVF